MNFSLLKPWRFLLLVSLTFGLILASGTGFVLRAQAQLTPAVTLANQQVAPAQHTDLVIWGLQQNQAAIALQSQGQWNAAETVLQGAISKLSSQDTFGQSQTFVLAQLLDSLAMGQLQQGQAAPALKTWQRAEQYYQQLGSTPIQQLTADQVQQAKLGNQLNQVQALRNLGFHRRAKQQLAQIQQRISQRPDDALKVKVLHSLGVTQRAVGEGERSQATLETALQLAQSLHLPATELNQVRLSLAKTLEAQGDDSAAQALYQQIQAQAPDLAQTIQPAQAFQTQSTAQEAALQQLQLWSQAGQPAKVWTEAQRLAPQLIALPPSRRSIEAQINLANILMDRPSASHTSASKLAPKPAKLVMQLLENALQQSRSLADPGAESYALGYLGRLYEQQQQTVDALSLTRQAIALAQQAQEPSALTQWQWQLGRLLELRGDRAGAIASCTQAFQGLENLQLDLVAMNPEVQFSYREQMEPVYRQLVDLLLSDLDQLPATQQQAQLTQARQVMEALQLAELQDYFRSACLTYDEQAIEEIDSQAAVIYPILLGDRIEVIASLPNQPLRHYSSKLSAQSQQQLFETMQTALHPIQPHSKVLEPAQQFYDILLRPLDNELAQQDIKTLVFVSDGFLRTVPMAALHDGQQFLVEKYALALSPGLQLLNAAKIDAQTLRNPEQLLLAGISQAAQGFLPLPAVPKELEGIKQLLPSQALLNEAFTSGALTRQFEQNNPSILHLATHGQFSSKAEETFLLAWDEQINVKDVDQLLSPNFETATGRGSGDESRRSLELLVLSACETAKGDQRATLGMAGVAVRSGARSTVASLWSVFDVSTSLAMPTFYENLIQADVSRAEALRRAQLALLNNPEYQHPYYWAPFVLIGNWL